MQVKIDLQKINDLVDEKRDFSTWKKFYRFMFAIVCAVNITTYNIMSESSKSIVNLYMLVLILVGFYQFLDWVEYRVYTKNINEMLRAGNEKVGEDEKKFGISYMFGGEGGGQA